MRGARTFRLHFRSRTAKIGCPLQRGQAKAQVEKRAKSKKVNITIDGQNVVRTRYVGGLT